MVWLLLIALAAWAEDPVDHRLRGTIQKAAPIARRALSNPDEPTPRLAVKVVLTTKELDQMVDVLYEFMQTPEGKDLMEKISQSENPSATQLWDRFFEKFRVWKTKNEREIPALQFLNRMKDAAALDVTLEYNEPELNRLLKEKVDDYFLNHTFTKAGKNHPRIARNIRGRQVDRNRSIYNRMVPPMLANGHKMVRAEANKQMVDMTGEIARDTGVQSSLRLVSNKEDQSNEGWFAVTYGGELLAHEFLPNGPRDDARMLAAMQTISRKLNEGQIAFGK